MTCSHHERREEQASVRARGDHSTQLEMMGWNHLVLCVVALAATTSEAAEPDPSAVAADIEPIDFAKAYETARRSHLAGLSADEAADVAQRIMEGEAPFMPMQSPTGSPGRQWQSAHGWISEPDAKLLQHEIIRSEGWPVVGDLDSPRLLQLSAPFPTWCEELAKRLTPALGGQCPDACDVFACEAGQRTPPLDLGDREVAAVLALGDGAALLTAQGDASDDEQAYPFPARNTVPLDPRNVLIIKRDAAGDGSGADRWGHCVHSGGRHLSLVFRSRCVPQK